jgi:SPP1 gp7 family putative phage head morphogenesis protein
MADPFLGAQIRNRVRFGGAIRLRRPKQWLFPHNAERALQERILKTVDVVETLTKSMVFPALQRMTSEASRVRGDAWSDDIETLAQQLRVRVDQQAPDESQATILAARDVSEFNSREWRGLVKQAIGIDIFTPEPWLRDELRSWSRETASLITTLEDDAVKQVSLWTNRGIRQGWRWEDIAKNIEDRFDVSRSRARFIARDQTGKLNGELTQRRQTQTGVTHYIWRDSRDERVRGNPGGLYPKAQPSHWTRNGQRFAWADAPEGGHPGRDYNCRCTAEPDLRGLLEAFKE